MISLLSTPVGLMQDNNLNKTLEYFPISSLPAWQAILTLDMSSDTDTLNSCQESIQMKLKIQM